MTNRVLTIILCLGLLTPNLAWTVNINEPQVNSSKWTNKYDRYFKKYTKHYFGPAVDWRWFKAQSITESSLKQSAVGAVGEIGLMQVKPSTFEYLKSKNPYFVELNDARWNIAAGIFYVRYLYNRWGESFDSEERLLFSFGSYNAGFGGINRAYRRAKKHHDTVEKWSQISQFAPKITQHYVKRIKKLKGIKVEEDE